MFHLKYTQYNVYPTSGFTVYSERNAKIVWEKMYISKQ